MQTPKLMSEKVSNYNVKLNSQTKFIYSTSGSQSSIVKHNSALNKLDLNLVYFTFPHQIDPETYANQLKSPIALGGAVTGKGGLKSTIIPFLDLVEPLSKKTLAVNTVVNKGGKLYGYNTDASGLKTALVQGIKSSGLAIKTAVIYGYGGVSGVAWHVLEELGIRTAMVGRNQDKLEEKKKELGIENIPHFGGPYDLVVDATPVSSDPHFLKATGFEKALKASKIVFCHNMPEKDGLQNHLKAYCEKNSISFIPGKWMYDAQLLKQYQLFLESYSITEKDIKKAWQIE